ncbi:MAG: sulfite exporter TauE/SafE family protein [Treponema sp.]|jgi:sulfite exporter TauE/SafE/copper chaperone CopZ/plastocyanin domain-containing protein|nr:sulfite exporter TauE/SafE family protein [Treponema sp.]
METAELQTQTFHVDGMTCVNCQNRIEKKLKNVAGVESASADYNTGTTTVTFNASIITFDEIKTTIEQLNYKVLDRNAKTPVIQIIETLFIIFVLFMLLRMFSTSSLAAAFPVAQTGMGYGMVLVIGLITSVHCIAMCGGINLSQTLGGGKAPLAPAILYNSGRVISYTAVGVVVGALGSVITVSGHFQGAVMLLAGIFMLIMGINMLGLFPSLRRFNLRLPKIFTKKIDEQKTNRGPLVVGFLNGFMPCGPLQAMQLYALSTGSPVRGGISMFLFCIGTVPLMFALGAASGFLSGAKGHDFSRRVMYAGAILIAAMGLVMFSNGWNLAGFDNPLNRMAAVNSSRSEGSAAIQNGVQIINSTLLPNRYPAIVVQQGIPVRWIINAPQGSINGCNNRFIIREYGIEHTFKYGENVIEFMPGKTGRFSYSCWMGMIRSSITVVAEGESIANVPQPSVTPTPAGVDIPTDEIAFAQITGSYQTVEIRLTDDGFEPAIVVMQRLLPARWNINIDSIDPGNNSLIFPAYYTMLDMEQGDNIIDVLPTDDFDFSTIDNVFYGYVKVVDDINSINIEAIKTEVANHETLIYPEAYFEGG